MGFQKGLPRHPNAGRKKGSKNKKKIAKVADLLAEKDINPVEKILSIIPVLDPEDQVKCWMDLLSYCQAKPREEVVPEDDESDELAGDEAQVPTEALLSLVQNTPEAT